MIKYLASILALTVASTASAATMLVVDPVPTPNVPGSTTYLLSLVGDDPINGIDASFAGPLNQVNPAGNPSIFTDANGFFNFVNADILDDSQFSFASGDVVSPTSEESANSLSAAFTNLTFLPAPFDPTNFQFAQLVIPDGETVEYTIELDVVGVGVERLAGVIPVPEPASFALAGLAMVGLAGIRRRK